MTTACVAMTASGAIAGGIERSSQSTIILFEKKAIMTELSFGRVSPNVSGVARRRVSAAPRSRGSKIHNPIFSVFGGLCYQTMQASVRVPIVSNYSISTTKVSGTGYVLGTAYEKPEIAFRVALSYNSKIDHTVSSAENTTAFGTGTTSTSFSTPEALNLNSKAPPDPAGLFV